MKFQSLLLLCISLLVFNCSNSDDSDGDQGSSDGEIALLFNFTGDAIQFTSTNNDFEIPCDFGEIDVTTTTSTGSDTFEFLDINIPYEAIIIGDAFALEDIFSDGLGGELISGVSLRVNGINYIAVDGGFTNLYYTQSTEQEGVLVFSCTAILTMEAVENPGEYVQVRIDVTEVGKGDETSC